ncbi:hypothetical protein KGF57_001243 [Candida theae]|uniref:PhoD-like phosphatase domain-containing protein n=1 Tax=Candida theae TaxID=1198502 RepID=A0AAD5BHG6_9ASCO|nr:uncharacterized protein KGF57_001243 [Candida theae]KAI5963439.1 hypothetical protein KGF57_001243 [Candida theae]
MPSAPDNQQQSTEDWFSPLPLDEYLKINELARQDVPKTRPIDPNDKLGDYDIRCGPILRLAGTLENNTTNYRGSIMLVVKDSPQGNPPPITYKIGPASESVSNGEFGTGEFAVTKYYEEDGYSFFRYTIELQLAKYEQKVEYYIDKFFKKSFQFFIPSVDESMNVISYSCNGFTLSCDASEFKSSLWYDVLAKHSQQHYHVMLGGGDQIYSDAIKLHSKKLQEWTQMHNPIKKSTAPVDDKILAEFNNFYLNHYMNWFGKGFWKGTASQVVEALFPLTMSQIPSVNIYDDHDIIDGFGSYHDSTMQAPIFSTVGNVAYKYYMLFQHHINPEEKLHLSDPSWVLGKEGPFIKQKNHSVFMRLGKEVSLLGLDCRTERKLKQICHPQTYQIIFNRMNETLKANGDVKHLYVMLGVPIFYPRLVWLEWLLTSRAMAPLRKLATKGVISKGLVNEFDGDVEVLDDLNDHWCSKHHKTERNKLIKDLMEFGSQKGIRITILSGDVHLGCIGRMKSKYHHHPNAHILKGAKEVEDLNKDLTAHPENDPRLIFNVISSAIVNAPPPDAMATLLNNRSGIHHFNQDTDEDIVPIFLKDADGKDRANHQFLNKRNWSDLVLAKQSVKYKSLIGGSATEGEEEEEDAAAAASADAATTKDESQVANGKHAVSDSSNSSSVLRKYPQPAFDNEHDTEQGDFLHDQEPNDRFIKYPLFGDSIVTSLRVEKDHGDLASKSTAYEVFIPPLIGSYKLGRATVKHVDV